jgi:hypothetical protein
VGNIADAISKAPIPQANWLGALMGLIPTPPASTGFTITGTLLQVPGQSAGAIQFAYELACTGPQRSVHLGTAEAGDAGRAIEVASREIYRTIGTAAPDIYPSWARWSTSEALTSYREGLEAEREGSDYAKACGRYLAASALDPDNMLARLRATNCRERMANGTEDEAERFRLRVLALAGYISIRVRWPEIFEPGFRASVLMSILASEADIPLDSDPLLRTTLDRYERATAKAARRHRSLPVSPSPSAEALCDRLESAALKEAKCVRHQLRPLWTLRHYQRLRHRFEPTGRERRQLRTALGISKMAQKARSERTRVLAPLGPASPQDRPEQLETAPWNTRSEARQLWWRALVRWRYLGARWHVAGWQAHYNAACFYALLPRAERSTRPLRGTRLRTRALTHLRFALDRAGDALDCVYVRDEDPDLETVRRRDKPQFTEVLGRVCPDDLLVHYMASGDGGTWKLRASGDAVTTDSTGYAWFAPVRVIDGTATFRVRIFDENGVLRLEPCRNGRPVEDGPGWELLPAALVTQEINLPLSSR